MALVDWNTEKRAAPDTIRKQLELRMRTGTTPLHISELDPKEALKKEQQRNKAPSVQRRRSAPATAR
jgi:hypothetical protein